MSLILIIMATILSAFWIVSFMSAKSNCLAKICIELLQKEQEEVEKKKQKIIILRKKLENATFWQKQTLTAFTSEKSLLKEIKTSIKKQEKLRAGKPQLLDVIPAMGYGVIDRLGIDSTMGFFKKMVDYNTALSDKTKAVDKTKYQLASVISYAGLGVSLSLVLGALLHSLSMPQQAIIVSLVGVVLSVLLAYLPLDALKEKVEARQDAITSEFPNAVSKLTLLVGSGIDVFTAWKQTAYSNFTPLNIEMQKVVQDIENGISSYESYNSFLLRCNNKFTSKLATSIMQNLKKGNEEICSLLGEISKESWSERRHFAKRMGEKAQSKLLGPMLMMFVGILILVIVPIMTNFGTMGI